MKVFIQIMILLLALIAAIVFLGQLEHANMWSWICLYWLVLTIKNIGDLITWWKNRKRNR